MNKLNQQIKELNQKFGEDRIENNLFKLGIRPKKICLGFNNPLDNKIKNIINETDLSYYHLNLHFGYVKPINQNDINNLKCNLKNDLDIKHI